MSLFRRRHHRAPLSPACPVFRSLSPLPRSRRNVRHLAEARYQAAVKNYQETWSYYQQARIDSYQVYVWSRLILDCQREMAEKPADHITALDEHLGRMKKLESLIKKVRRLGFGRSYDVGASEYYRLEAEYWLARDSPGHDDCGGSHLSCAATPGIRFAGVLLISGWPIGSPAANA